MIIMLKISSNVLKVFIWIVAYGKYTKYKNIWNDQVDVELTEILTEGQDFKDRQTNNQTGSSISTGNFSNHSGVITKITLFIVWMQKNALFLSNMFVRLPSLISF